MEDRWLPVGNPGSATAQVLKREAVYLQFAYNPGMVLGEVADGHGTVVTL